MARRDFGAWLLRQLPWQAESLKSAVATARTNRFYDYFVHSDFQAGLEPQFEDLGFGWRSTNSSSLSATGPASSKPSTRGLVPMD